MSRFTLRAKTRKPRKLFRKAHTRELACGQKVSIPKTKLNVETALRVPKKGDEKKFGYGGDKHDSLQWHRKVASKAKTYPYFYMKIMQEKHNQDPKTQLNLMNHAVNTVRHADKLHKETLEHINKMKKHRGLKRKVRRAVSKVKKFFK